MNKIVEITIGAFVAIIMVAAVMAPILNDSIALGDEETNTGATVYYSNAPATLTFDSDKKYKIDGVAVDDLSIAYVFSDSAFVRMFIGTHNSGMLYLSNGTSKIIRTLQVYDNHISYALSSSPNTYVDLPCEWVYYSNPAGHYATFNGTFNANVKEHVVAYKLDAPNYVYAAAELGKTNTAVAWNWGSSGQPLSATIAETGFSNDKNVDSWNEAEWTIAAGTQSYTGTEYIAPLTYYENATGTEGSFNSILGVIPVVTIAALLIGIAAAVIIKRD